MSALFLVVAFLFVALILVDEFRDALWYLAKVLIFIVTAPFVILYSFVRPAKTHPREY